MKLSKTMFVRSLICSVKISILWLKVLITFILPLMIVICINFSQGIGILLDGLYGTGTGSTVSV
jgi:hypothetical protein